MKKEKVWWKDLKELEIRLVSHSLRIVKREINET